MGIMGSFQNPKLEIRNTRNYGLGVFARKEIRGGEVIMVLDGEILSCDEIMGRIRLHEENIDDPLQIDEWLFLDLDEVSRTFNHSCDPNAGMRKRSELFALRDILPGEEITYDYSSVVGPKITPDMWTMECDCGASTCRKTIGNVLSIPEDRFRMYLKAGALQDHILVALKLTTTGSDR
jgi:uncharacterized protein